MDRIGLTYFILFLLLSALLTVKSPRQPIYKDKIVDTLKKPQTYLYKWLIKEQIRSPIYCVLFKVD